MNRLLFIAIILCLFNCTRNSSIKEQEQKLPKVIPQTHPEQLKNHTLDAGHKDPERTEWQNPELVLSILGNLEDKTVADIGAGAGYFSFKIAGKAKKVIALDIDPKALDYIKSQIEIVGDWANNIEPRLTPADVPNLLDNEADIVLVVNTFAIIPKKENYLLRLLKSIREDGRLVIIDFKPGTIPVGPSDKFKLEPEAIIKMLRNTGFQSLKKDEKSLRYQYIITARK